MPQLMKVLQVDTRNYTKLEILKAQLCTCTIYKLSSDNCLRGFFLVRCILRRKSLQMSPLSSEFGKPAAVKSVDHCWLPNLVKSDSTFSKSVESHVARVLSTKGIFKSSR